MPDTAPALPKAILLKDYQPPAWQVRHVDLTFQLGPDVTIVTSRLTLARATQTPADAPLILDRGRDLEVLSVRRDDTLLAAGSEYRLDATKLMLPGPLPADVTLEIVTRLEPHKNTELEGLYRSATMFCTQCEAEGFRRITCYPDRPDVMARFSVTIEADRATCPVLLSNGNLVAQGNLPDGRHFARWDDPFPKPAYLFALVAGDLVATRDHITTASGRKVELVLWTIGADADKTGHAMASLIRSMQWDEQVYGLEYDLDAYHIVAVGDFNMGAMENKGLNIFNTKYVLARPETATDADYTAIEAVIAHEYFHNWTGNRVTCRDWFQLSLKEGLTVFRDQQFSMDMGSAAVKRIADVRMLRAGQFPEDAGPMAHPIRPDSYIEINNFYTSTVYNKGAEVVRMIHTLLGPQRFRAGMDLYFQRHDGQAVTCDDFTAAMQDASGVDLSRFRRWYAQAGTPELTLLPAWDETSGTYTLTVRQHTKPTPGQPDKLPFHIPLRLALLAPDGQELPLVLDGEDPDQAKTDRVLDVLEAEQSFRFTGLPARPVPSLLRGFSAPVKLSAPLSDEELAFLLAHDREPFARWEAGQQLATRLILAAVATPATPPDLAPYVAAINRAMAESPRDDAFLAQLLALPAEAYLAELMTEVDVDGIHRWRSALRHALAQGLRPQLSALLADHRAEAYRFEPAAVGRRALLGTALDLLMLDPTAADVTRCVAWATSAPNMTEQLAALTALADTDLPDRPTALATFEAQWRNEALVMDKWFALQARSTRPDTLSIVQGLLHHPAFDLKNPNKVYALVGAFCNGNRVRFHAADGGGYRFLADQVLALDRFNGKVAARLLQPIQSWRRYDAGRRALMQAELQRILASPGLSRDVYEIVAKSLDNG